MQCRAFEAGEKKDTCERDCSYFQLIKVKDKLPQPTDQSFPLSHCKERDANDCWFYYTYAIRNDTKEVYVRETLGELLSYTAKFGFGIFLAKTSYPPLCLQLLVH